ncbi:MAG: redoxin domain-containing protein [Flavobacteriales bacterium]|nr:redoxin domain-containing protein [Flavobacteriales bacterium]
MRTRFKIITLLSGVLAFGMLAVYYLVIYPNRFDTRIRMLPDIRFETTSGNELRLHHAVADHAALLINFNPRCHLCTEEIFELKKHHADFSETRILLASSQPLAELDSFSKAENMHMYPGITIVHDIDLNMVRLFGATITPSTYIYDKSHRLVDVFEGDTDIENILRSVKSD